MTNAERRYEVLQALKDAERPVSATVIANRLEVSRQIIVGDVALLRASGVDIVANSRGYIMGSRAKGRYVVVCRHSEDAMSRELELMVDHGCTVLNVAVEHPVYGQIVGRLDLSTREDVEEFMAKVRMGSAKPLSDLTDGVHTHTLYCTKKKSFEALREALRAEGFLVE